jgi:hypothetical protein
LADPVHFIQLGSLFNSSLTTSPVARFQTEMTKVFTVTTRRNHMQGSVFLTFMKLTLTYKGSRVSLETMIINKVA